MAGTDLKRVLTLTDVVLFNIVVVFSVRGMTTAARMGPVSVLLWLVAVAAFFVPLGLTIAELATRDPGEGGFYRWTRSAFGEAPAFLGGWFYWVSNLTYLPSLLIFLASAVAYTAGRPGLAEDPWFVGTFAMAMLWFVTWLNIRGLQVGRLVTSGGAAASWVAAVLLVAAGAFVWLRFGSATSWSLETLTRASGGHQTLAYFGTLSFALVGQELAPLMGGEIREPQRTIPRALLLSGVAIAALYLAGTLAILAALSPEEVSPVSGAFGAVTAVADRTGWQFLPVAVAGLVSVSVVGGLTAWLGGVARLPYVVGLDRFLPAVLARLHPRHGSPYVAILLQSVLTAVFIVASQSGSTVTEAYLVLLDMTIVLNFVPFIAIFLALPRLRGAGAEPGVVRVPGGRGVLWLVAGAGVATTLLTLLSAVIPGPDVQNPAIYEAKLWGGLGFFSVIGYVIYARHRGPRL